MKIDKKKVRVYFIYKNEKVAIKIVETFKIMAHNNEMFLSH